MVKFILILFQIGILFAQEDYIWSQYNQGVEKAKTTYKLNYSRPLFNIDSNNLKIEVECKMIWGCNGDVREWEKEGLFKNGVRIKVVTLVNLKNQEYKPYVKFSKPYKNERYPIWVTVSPELYEFCRTVKDKTLLPLELSKFLGLPPSALKSDIITMWVDPMDLFRPCLDPNVSTTKCPIVPGPKTSPIHLTWLNDTLKKSYEGSNIKYPFTSMGFSFYWGNKDIQGASEYLIRAGATIWVEKFNSIFDYCK